MATSYFSIRHHPFFVLYGYDGGGHRDVTGMKSKSENSYPQLEEVFLAISGSLIRSYTF
jgi:hypothetical protein